MVLAYDLLIGLNDIEAETGLGREMTYFLLSAVNTVISYSVRSSPPINYIAEMTSLSLVATLI